MGGEGGGREWGVEGLIFEILAPEVHARKIYFPQYDICVKKILWHIVALKALARFRIVRHPRCR